MSIAVDLGGRRPPGRVGTQNAEEASRAAKERLRECSIAGSEEAVKGGLRERYLDVDDYDPVLRYHCRL